MPQEEVIKCKIYRAEDGNNHEPQWERPGFKKDEIETRVKDVVMFRNNYLPNCYKLFVEVTYELPKKGRNEPLGISNRHGLVTRVNYASPFKGSILPGDVLLSVNGTNVCFEEKTIMGQVEDKTTSQQSKQKNPEKKGTGKEGEKKDAKPAFWTGAQEFKSVISKILASKKETKITITVARLKTRVGTFKCPPGITPTPGYNLDLALLYQFKYLKLGLNMQQTGQRVVVNYTMPDSVSHISLNIGEAILAVDENVVTNLEDVRTRILDGCKANGWVRLIVEYPDTDQFKNMVRGQLATAQKTNDRPNYSLCGDVKKYCEEGVEALKNGKELDPVLKEPTKGSDRKEPEKKKTESLVEFRKTTDEIGIPTEWNSKLFVLLPPLKTKDSESTDNSQMKK